MVLLALIAVIITLKKKQHRYLPVTGVAFVYGLANFIVSFAVLADTLVHRVSNALAFPLAAVLLVLSILLFLKPNEDGKKNYVPVILCAGIVVDRIIKRLAYFINSLYVITSGVETIQLSNGLLIVVTALDVIHLLLACTMMIRVIACLNKTNTESIT